MKKQNIILFVAAWCLALFYGIGVLLVSGAITQPLIGRLGEDAKDVAMFFLLSSLVIILSWISLNTLASKPFFRFFRYALIVGFILNIGLGIVVIAASAEKSSSGSSCSSLQDQLENATASTYAITTNTSSGTGFAISNNGYIITNAHVIEGADEIHTWHREAENSPLSKLPLQVISNKPEIDLAILKASFPTSSYINLNTGDYRVGEQAYAIGFPGNSFSGGDVSVSQGVVSRQVTSEYNDTIPKNVDFIQTDAAINPGNSGGPLINRCGAIGVNTAISRSDVTGDIPREEGIGYAISAKVVQEQILPEIYSQLTFN